MKMFNKLLAAVLSVIMLLTVVPVAAFADTGAGTSAPSGSKLPVTVTVPDFKGTGADGTVTLHLDASAILDVLRAEDSVAALKQAIRDMVERSNEDVITVNDIMALVPVDAIVSSLLGENNENASAIIEQIGGIEHLKQMLDFNALIATANKTDLVDFVLSLDGLADSIYADKVLEMDIDFDLSVAYGYIDQDALAEKMKGLTYDELLAMVGGSTDNLKKIVYYDALLQELLDSGKINLNEAADFDALMANETVKTAIVDTVKANYKDLLTPAGIAKVQNIIMDSVNADLVTEASFKDGQLMVLANELAGNSLLDYVNLTAVLADASVQDFVMDQIAGLSNEEKLALLTEEAKAEFQANPGMQLTVDHLIPGKAESILRNALTTEGQTLPPTLDDLIKANFDTAAFINDYKPQLTAKIKADAENYVKNAVPTTYIKETVVDSLVDDALSTLDFNIFTNADFNESKLHDTVLEIVNTNNINVLDYLKEGFNPFAIDGVTAIVMNHVNWDEVNNPAVIDRVTLLNTILGENGKLSDLMTPENMKAYIQTLDLTPVFDKVESGELTIDEICNVDLLIDSIPTDRYGTLINIFDRNTLIEQLKPHAKELLQTLTKDQVKAILAPLVSSVLQNVDLISINGYDVAKENETGDNAGILGFDFHAIAGAIVSVIPTFEELSRMEDGKVIDLNFYARYQSVDGETVVKDVNLAVIIEGDMTTVRKVAAKLAQHIDLYNDGNQIYLAVRMPEVITRAYVKFLTTEQGQELKKQILGLADKTGEELLEAFRHLELQQILDLMAKVDVEKVYSYVLNLSYVETCLEKILEKTGLDYNIADLQDLNKILDSVADGVPSFEAICDAVSRRAGFDIMQILQKVADFGDRNQYVQALIKKLEGVPYFGQFINEHELTEILNTYKDVEPVKFLSDYIKDKTGADLQKALQTYDANELYRKAVEKARGYESYYEKAKNFLLNMMDPDFVPTTDLQKFVKGFIPTSLLNKFLHGEIHGLYKGDGQFGGAKTSIDLNLGAISDKVINALKSRVNISDSTWETVKGFLPSGTINFGIHADITFPGLAQVTYLDEEGLPLLKTYLANGVNPTVALDAPVIAERPFLYWADAAGNEVTAISGDMTLKAVYEEKETPPEPPVPVKYTVIFKDWLGNKIAEYTVEEGKTLPSMPVLNSPASYGLINGDYFAQWYVKDLSGEKIDARTIFKTVVKANAEYTFRYEQSQSDSLFHSDDDTVKVEKDETNNWTVTLNSKNAVLTLNPNKVVFAPDSTLKLVFGDVVMNLDSVMLSQLLDEADITGSGKFASIEFSSRYGKTYASKIETPVYEYQTKDVYDFSVRISNQLYHSNFLGEYSITVPFAQALATTGNQRTSVYLLSDDGTFQRITSFAAEGVSVTFAAPHFSEFMIVNEYKIACGFTGVAVTGSSNVDNEWIPAGATISHVIPTLDSSAIYGNIIDEIYYRNEAGNKVYINKVGDPMIMPACPVGISCVVKPLDFEAIYVIGNKRYSASEVNAHLSEIVVPFGYKLAKDENNTVLWVGKNADDVQATVYLTPKFVPVDYTLTFAGVSGTVKFNVENYASAFFIPAVPVKAGCTGIWKDLASDPLQVIRDLNAANVTSKTVEAVYTEKTYQVFAPTGVVNAAFGKPVTLDIKAGTGHKLVSVSYVNMTTGETVDITNNQTFTMPASNVRIVVKEAATVLHFTTVDAQTGESKEHTVNYGDYASFEIRVPKNYILETAPNLGTLVSFHINEDGSKTLTYSIPADETLDAQKISYKVSLKVPTTVQLSNGLVSTGDPTTSVDGLTFGGFTGSENTSFDASKYEFAIFRAEEKTNTLLWLWILLAVAVVIALIALLYSLFINGKLKPNFFLRFIAWLVGIFYSICLGFSKLVLLVAQGTTKKEKIDFTEYGMSNPDPEEDAPKASEEDENKSDK